MKKFLNIRSFGSFVVASVVGLCGQTVLAQSSFDGKGGEQLVADVAQQLDDADLASLEGFAIEQVAASKGLDAATLAVEQSSIARYPMSGTTAYAFKITGQDGQSHMLTIDESGMELDPSALQAGEQAAYETQFGKLHPELAEILPLVPGNEPVPVIIWVNDHSLLSMPRPDPSIQLSKEESNALAAQLDESRKMEVAALVAPVGQFLADVGFEVSAEMNSPAIFAQLDAKTIAEVSKLPDVAGVYLDNLNEANMSIARQVVRANIVNGRGFSGGGVRVGEVEVGGMAQAANPFLAGILNDPANACLSSHSTAVAGMIRSTHATERGVAPAVALRVGGSCGGWSSELQSATNRGVTWGARVFNNSWGSTSGSRVPDANARFFDDITQNSWRTVVFAAGNRGGPGCSQGTDGVVTNPAIAYNVIAVGNFNDNNTLSTVGDTMNSCSSWLDPTSTHSDREKPEVAAPGTNITSTTTASPWIGNTGSGTSYSSPIVAGTAALLINRNAGLSVWPEAVKAILMATALQNIEGATRLSEKDGAGGINADRADDVARGVNGNWGARSYDCAAAADTDVLTMSLVAGKRTRVVICWDQNPSYGSYSSQPSADLDLRVINPGGATVASSLSFDNTYEIVDFTPATSGVYKIRVHKFRCDLTPKWLGYAWYRLP